MTRPTSRTPGARSAIPHSPFRTPHSRAALTLIEMLISLVVTLVMMAAVVNLFANMSASIRDRRAGIELGGQLRQVRQQLIRDLAGATCPAVPWQKPGNDVGYLEIVEGFYNDYRPSALVDDPDDDDPNDLELDYDTSQVPSSQVIDPTGDFTADGSPQYTDGRALGDYDDVLAMTVRSKDEPFIGLMPWGVDDGAGNFNFDNPRTLESDLAEVLWFAVENPQDDPDTDEDERIVDDPTTTQNEQLVGGIIREPGMRTVYRRPLLIAPWVANNPGVSNTNNGPLYLGTGLDMTQKRQRLIEFQWQYGISARVEPTSDYILLNTLDDCTKRENRFAHNPASNPGGPVRFPHVMSPLLSRPEWLVAANALAFDVRVYDPGAPLLEHQGVVLEPCDIGWMWLILRQQLSNMPPTPYAPVGYGAYVDLGWAWNPSTTQPTPLFYPNNGTVIAQPAGAPEPLFNEPRAAGWHPLYAAAAQYGGIPYPYSNFNGYPAVYDTWSLHYENDGVEQDQLYNVSTQIRNQFSTYQPEQVLDQGTNGVDDDGDALGSIAPQPGALRPGGVDDPLERETSPPYPTPLRGLKVILRTYEPDSRQIRESSVTHSFVP